MTGKILSICGLAILSLALGGNFAEGGVPQTRLVQGWGWRPLAFEKNRGQTDASVRFLSRGSGYNLFLTSTEAVLALRAGDSGRVLRLRWEGAAPAPRVSGEAELPGRSHYLLGNDPAKWKTGIPSYGKVRYQGLYPGIDLVFYGNQEQLEYDFVIAPGADLRAIRLTVEGADRLEIDPAGDLVLHLRGSEVRLRKPVAYQEIEGSRREVASGYRLLQGDDRAQVGFQTAEYVPDRPLVIDPVLVYSTYLGGGDIDWGQGIAVDAAGNAYVTGYTASADFPIQNAMKPQLGISDAFVTKLDPTGALVYSTYFGGFGYESAFGIAVDPTGSAYITGYTTSFDFPQVNPLPSAYSGDLNGVFVARLNASGSALVYSVRLGGSGFEEGRSIAVDPQGSAYVTGYTDSLNFPAVSAVQTTRRGDVDAFVSKLSASGSLVYSTYLGGSAWDFGHGISVDALGHAHVAGVTGSGDFPLTNALQGFPRGLSEAFVAKLQPAGSAFVYSTYLGGSSDDLAWAIAADSGGNAWVAGYTLSSDFPTFHAFQGNRPDVDGFVTRLTPAGSLAASTYLGGSSLDQPTAIAVDRQGSAYVTGYTRSADYPLKDPVQDECEPDPNDPRPLVCNDHAFVTKLDPAGSSLAYSTFLGGNQPTSNVLPNESGRGIAVDASGNALVAGLTTATDFPIANAFQPFFGGGLHDAFVAKLAANHPPDCSTSFASPATLWPPNGKFIPLSIRGVTDPDGDLVTLTVTAIRQDEPLTRAGVPDATGLGTPIAQIRSDRAGGGDGRVYRIAFEAHDGQGGTCTGTVTVCVPHDQGRGRTCGDGGGFFNSAVSNP